MRWISVNDGIPPIFDEVLGRSVKVLCQNNKGQTFMGYVKQDMDTEWEPCWIQDGRDMYTLQNIVRWIFLRKVVGEIN